MADTVRDIVIVGGGLAAAKAAEAVRAEGFDGTVTLLTEEPERPYERPPLSKGFLVGKQPVDDVFVHAPEFYPEHDIALHIGDPATHIDRKGGQVHTRSGRRLRFDRLLLATGAAPRRLPLGDLDGIAVLRTLQDSRWLVDRLRSVGHVTVVGAGWIGCEVAAAARTLGTAVTMVDPVELPLLRVLGPDVGRVFRDLHRDHGVDLRLGVGLSEVHGTDAVERVTLGDGSSLDTELVVVGVGVTPRVELAEEAGLEIDDGVVTDETLTTSDPRILAAGDIANAWHPALRRRVRVEHWANALNQGTTAGRNLVGAGEPYARLPYFFSDQYDLGMEYSGLAEASDPVVFRGAVESREFIAFWVRDGHVIAGMNVNVWDVVEDIQALIRSEAPIDLAALADPAVPLADLAGDATGPE
jgi:3-phenylpropionate/trans-cinnamate dioxygenase ferredoxin reductase subunit